ncbi:MAG: hypothetical protein BWY25_02412 [Chloroflexi bacterium ADurb.Bin222]|nr:MAG: hypothetical protein BWY25_02412 [Chloroflexi bacterium ADurb.Bin222]
MRRLAGGHDCRPGYRRARRGVGDLADNGAVAARCGRGFDRRQGVDLTPAGRIVRHVRAAAGAVIVGDRGRRILDDRLGRSVIADQARRRAPHQGNQAGDVRRGHRSAAPTALVGRVAGIDRRANIDTWRQHLRLQVRPPRFGIHRVGVVRRAPVGVGRVLAVVAAARADASDVAVPRRVAHRVQTRRGRITAVAGVAVGENGVNASCVPGIYDILIPGVIARAAIAPGVIHGIGALVGVGVGAGQIPRGREELGAFQQLHIPTTAGITATAGHPLGAGGHADLIGAAIVAHHRAHRVRTMAVVVARLGGMVAIGVPPVVVVVKRTAAQIAAIVVHQRIMGVTHPGVHAGHHDPLASVSLCPDLVGQHVQDVGFNRRRGHSRGSCLCCLIELQLSMRPQGLDLRESRRQRVEGLEVRLLNRDDVVNPEGLIVGPLRIQVSPDPGLRALRRRLQGGGHKASARDPVHGIGLGEIGPFVKIDEIACALICLELLPQRRLDFNDDRWVSRRRGADANREQSQHHCRQHQKVQPFDTHENLLLGSKREYMGYFENYEDL